LNEYSVGIAEEYGFFGVGIDGFDSVVDLIVGVGDNLAMNDSSE